MCPVEVLLRWMDWLMDRSINQTQNSSEMKQINFAVIRNWKFSYNIYIGGFYLLLKVPTYLLLKVPTTVPAEGS
jgi:hypothetical protein